MEKRHKQINELITKIALGNPNITQEQITRTRTMYNGDTRPLKEIEQELLEYSAYISSNSKEQQKQTSSILTSKGMEAEELSLEKTLPIPSIIPIVEEQTPEEEMSTMFEEYQNQPMMQQISETTKKQESPKQLVKTQPNEKGYGNVSGLLTIAAILSIMTAVMAIFTILTN